MRGLRVGRRRTNSFRFRYRRHLRSKAYSTFTTRSYDKYGVPKTPEEIIEFYRKIFESLGIPFPRLRTMGSYRIPKKGRGRGRRNRNRRRYEMRSPLHSENPEPPMKFETRREFPRRRIGGFQGARDGSYIGYRPERLPPPLPEKSEGPWEEGWDGVWRKGPVVMVMELKANPSMPTPQTNHVEETQTSERRPEVEAETQTSQRRPEVKVERKRYKFHSDKNHELSEDEDEEDPWSVGSLITVSVSSQASSSGKSTHRGDSEQWGSGLGGSKDIIPSLEPSGDGSNNEPKLETSDSTHDDHNFNSSAFQPSSSRASVGKPAPHQKYPGKTSSGPDYSSSSKEVEPAREPSVAGSSSFSSVIGKFEVLSVTSGTEMPSLSRRHCEDRSCDDDDEDDQDILIIGLTQEEMDEFK